MTNHPRQREMWEGLTGLGCVGLICILIGVTVFMEYVK